MSAIANGGRKLKNSSLRPNKAEVEFLALAYNRYYDIYDEVFQDSFWKKDSYYRFCKIKDAFLIYSELLNYEPIKWVIEEIKIKRPPMEAELSGDLLRFVRNLIVHFPIFDCWTKVNFKRSLINWNKEGQFIDRFLNKHCGLNPVKYRFWETSKKKFTYISIVFPREYNDDTLINLKDIISEKDGVKFSFILMKRVIDTQVEHLDL